MATNLKRTFLPFLTILSAILCIFVLLGQAKLATAASTENFVIKSFEADYYLDRNEHKTSTLRVTEAITAQFPDYDQNHGIIRSIPKTYQEHTVSLHIEQVLLNGQKVRYESSSVNNNLVLKIGDSDVFVRGLQKYTIVYSMRNVAGFFSEHDEFYWDINGDQWAQNFEKVIGRIHVAPGIASQFQNNIECFSGIYGSASKKCSITSEKQNEGWLVTVQAEDLKPRSTLTVAMSFESNTFELGPEVAAEAAYRRNKTIALTVAGLGFPIGTLFALLYKWFKYGRDPRGRGVIIPEYRPSKDLSLLSGSVLLDERLNNKAISASLLDLAVRGYLVIYEIPKKGLFGKKKYEVELIKEGADLSREEQDVLDMFFGSYKAVGKRLNVGALQNSLYPEVEKLDKFLAQNLKERGYFSSDPEKIRQKYISLGLVASFVGGFGMFVLGSFWPIGAGVLVSGLITLALAKAMPARTKLGVSAREHLLGLKKYMELAEADRIKFLQSPEGAEKVTNSFNPEDPREKVKLFEKLLPYAMLFGIEKQWAKEFKDLYKQPPDWYHGNWSAFNAAYLASSVSGFGASTAPSAPSSSSSSGLGGGGFSGGGGGGGGGGGW